ncbi:hypothetical protein GQ472_01660 [archaeon]|nr:hypothetical protein [archaeon]
MRKKVTTDMLVDKLQAQYDGMGLTLRELGSLQPSKNLSLDSIPEWGRRRFEVWCRIYNEGGSVSFDRFKEICIKAGYSTADGDGGLKTKGIGGLFSGGKNARIQWGANGSDVFLTGSVKGYVEAWTGFTMDEVAGLFK